MGDIIRIAAIVAFAAIVGYIVFGIPTKNEDKKEEEQEELPEPQSVRATLIEKACGTQHIGNPYITSTLHYESYEVMFSCEDGEERAFQVEPDVFSQLKEGTEGLLVYLDNTFYAFDTEVSE